VTIAFLQLESVTFEETGLPAKTLAKDGWTVVLNGSQVWSRKATISFNGTVNGTYPLLVTGPAGYVETTGNLSTVRVSGATSISIAFATGRTLSFTVSERGLAKHQEWCISLDHATSCTTQSSQRFVNLTWSPTYGTYSFALLSPLSGQKVAVTGAGSSGGIAQRLYMSRTSHYLCTFVYDYRVTFTETGAPAGTWSVAIGKDRASNSTADPIYFELPNGTYGYKIVSIPGYTSVGSPKKILVDGAPASVVVTFTGKHDKSSPALTPLAPLFGGPVVVGSSRGRRAVARTAHPGISTAGPDPGSLQRELSGQTRPVGRE